MLCTFVLRCHSCLGSVTSNNKSLMNAYFIVKPVIDLCQLSVLSCAHFVRNYVTIRTDNCHKSMYYN